MGFLSDFFSNPLDTIGAGFQTGWNALADIPGSPEAIYNAFDGGLNGDYSWNPYDPNGASAWDVIGGGESLSEDPNNRKLGRSVGTAIGTYFTGGALGNWLGSTTAGNVAAGALSSGAQAAATDGDVGDAALKGGAYSYLNSVSPNYAGYAGVTNPIATSAINSGVNSGLRAGLEGGDVTAATRQGALSGGIQGGLSEMFAPDYYNQPGGSSRAPWATEQNPFLSGGEYGAQQSQAPWAQGTSPSFYSSTGRTEDAPAMQEDTFSGKVYKALGLDSVSFGNGRVNFGDTGSLRYGDLAQGLMGMYGGWQQRKAAKEALAGLAGRRAPYEQAMRNNLMAKDRAAGRRSNVGGREVQLQAALADLDSRNAPMVAALQNQQFSGLADILRSGNMMLNRGGFYGPREQYQAPSPTLQTLNTTPMSVDYSMQRKNPFGLQGSFGGYGG